MPPRILLAHPLSAQPHARDVAARLEKLGYQVQACTPRAQRGDRHKVVMLWSRAAQGTPALRAAARKAHAAGKLVCIRLDSAPPPVHGAPMLPLKRTGAWRQALRAKPRPAAGATTRPVRARLYTARAKRVARPIQTVGTDMRLYSASSSRTFAIVLSLCLIGAAALGLAYGRYPQVAASIDGAAAAVYAQASEIAALAP